MRKFLEAVVEEEGSAAMAGVGITFAVYSSVFCDSVEQEVGDQESVEEAQTF